MDHCRNISKRMLLCTMPKIRCHNRDSVTKAGEGDGFVGKVPLRALVRCDWGHYGGVDWVSIASVPMCFLVDVGRAVMSGILCRSSDSTKNRQDTFC